MPGRAFSEKHREARVRINQAHPLPATRRMKVWLDDDQLCPRRILLTLMVELLTLTITSKENHVR